TTRPRTPRTPSRPSRTAPGMRCAIATSRTRDVSLGSRRLRDRPGARRAATAGLVVLTGVTAGCSDGMLAPVNDRAGTVALVWWVMLAISTAVLILVLVVLGAGLVRAHRSTG